jgi:hypothetical protein
MNLDDVLRDATEDAHLLYLDLPNTKAFDAIFSCPLTLFKLLDQHGCDAIQLSIQGTPIPKKLDPLSLDCIVQLMKLRSLKQWEQLLHE